MEKLFIFKCDAQNTSCIRRILCRNNRFSQARKPFEHHHHHHHASLWREPFVARIYRFSSGLWWNERFLSINVENIHLAACSSLWAWSRTRVEINCVLFLDNNNLKLQILSRFPLGTNWQFRTKLLMAGWLKARRFLLTSTYPLAPIIPAELSNTFELLQIHEMIV